MTRTQWRTLFMIGLAVAAGTTVLAQRGGFGATQSHVRYDGRFVFMRMAYTDGGFGFRGGGPRWAHDWPRGESHFLKILSELTSAKVNATESSVMTWGDPEVFKFPVAYMAEPGYWTMNDADVRNFKAYLQKGGYLILDDFRGNDWGNMEMQVGKAFPQARWVELDVNAPIFHSFYEIVSMDLIPQYYDRGRPMFIGLHEDNDPNKRLMIVAAYNTDLSEFWEWSDTDFAPIEANNEAYKIGVNLFMYGMTH